ncbi:hypothetical protein [Microbacterium sp. MMO-56]|uniref:hypothetical protein n=1 Tax=Microbacterium sp. MMO-56 TaxID=3081281 RepID=UPI00301AFA16
MTAVLTRTPAAAVQAGDRLDAVAGERPLVTRVTRGANRQIYIATVTAGGAPVVVERDPGEPVSVWRER